MHIDLTGTTALVTGASRGIGAAIAERLAAELAETEPGGVLYANQWDNPSNGDGHYRSTGPEIWTQTGGGVDAFCCAIGTGGTLSGVGRYLKEQNPDVKIIAADPEIEVLTAGEVNERSRSLRSAIESVRRCTPSSP